MAKRKQCKKLHAQASLKEKQPTEDLNLWKCACAGPVLWQNLNIKQKKRQVDGK